MDEDLIIELWDVFKEYVPEKNREGAATHYVDFLVGKDVDSETLQGLIGYDQYLDQAIDLVAGNEEKDDDGVDDWDPDDEDY